MALPDYCGVCRLCVGLLFDFGFWGVEGCMVCSGNFVYFVLWVAWCVGGRCD